MNEPSTPKIQVELPDEINLNAAEREAIAEFNKVIPFKKGAIIVKEGEVNTISYHVVKGCVRQYYLVDGEEKTTNFYTDNQSITPASSLTDLKPSKHYLECLEVSHLTAVSPEQEKALYDTFPRLESLCRMYTEKALSESQEEFAKFVMSSPEERYLNVLNNRPELLNRVPQYQLASYLGMKPESLSRIRKRIVKKG